LRVLITGASGFAGGYLARACASAGDEVVGISRSGLLVEGGGAGRAVDLRDADLVRGAVRAAQPEVVYHLAALSSVGRSWEDPAETVQSNVGSDVNMLEALRLEAPQSRVVWVSSCQIYGVPERLPVAEDAPMQPDNPYGVSKAAGEMLAAVYADAHGLDLVRARPFNHAGPGQHSAFTVSSLAGAGADAPAAAWPTAAAEARGRRRGRRGRRRGRGRAGAIDRIAAATGWRPEIPFGQTMRDTIEWWERELRLEAAEWGPSRS
jgi:GDP-4-dehydro-6-deoxy-D-mannose reductase